MPNAGEPWCESSSSGEALSASFAGVSSAAALARICSPAAVPGWTARRVLGHRRARPRSDCARGRAAAGCRGWSSRLCRRGDGDRARARRCCRSGVLSHRPSCTRGRCAGPLHAARRVKALMIRRTLAISASMRRGGDAQRRERPRGQPLQRAEVLRCRRLPSRKAPWSELASPRALCVVSQSGGPSAPRARSPARGRRWPRSHRSARHGATDHAPARAFV